MCVKCARAKGSREWMKAHPGGNKPKRPSAAAAAQQQLLDLARAYPGDTIPKLLNRLDPPRQVSTYKAWRRTVPGFREKFDAIRSHAAFDVELEDPNRYDFGYRRLKYFGHETYAHQLALVNAVQETQEMHVTLCLLPPGHGKTATIEDFICDTLAREPNHRFGLVSETDVHVRKIVGTCQRRMRPRETTDFSAKYGPFYEDGQERNGKPWTASHFTVFKSNHDERDYSVASAGIGSHVYGSRWDTLIIDDVQSRRSINRTEEMLRTIQQDFFSRVLKGRIVIIGTRVGIGDIYERLEEEGLVDTIIKMPVHNHVNPERFTFDDGTSVEIGEPLWPEQWTKQQLALKWKKSGRDTWECAFMQEPHSAALTTFTDELVDLAKDQKPLLPGELYSPGKARSIGRLKEHLPVTLGLDPALGGGCAITAFGCKAEHLLLLDCEKQFGFARVEEILALIETFAIRFNPNRLVVERDAFQKGLVTDQRLQQLAQRSGFEIIPHTSSRNKSDEVLGVASMASAFRSGEFRIPYGDELARQRMAPLLKELENWRPGVNGRILEQDLVMSCWFVWKNWMETRDELNPTIFREARPSWMGTSLTSWRDRRMGRAS